LRAPYLLTSIAAAGQILSISRFTRDLVAGLPAEVSNPRVVSPSIAAETERLARLDQISAPGSSSGLSLVTVARLVERRGIQHTIEALAILQQQGIDARLAVVGAGSFEGRLRCMASERGLTSHVTFLGPLDDEDAVAVVCGADVFVLTPFESEPGQCEGYGIAYLEAGALRKPVIGTRSGGIPEAILEHKTGLLAEPASPASIAGTIARLWESKELGERLGAAGRQWALAHSPRAAGGALAQALGMAAL